MKWWRCGYKVYTICLYFVDFDFMLLFIYVNTIFDLNDATLLIVDPAYWIKKINIWVLHSYTSSFIDQSWIEYKHTLQYNLVFITSKKKNPKTFLFSFVFFTGLRFLWQCVVSYITICALFCIQLIINKLTIYHDCLNI